MKYTKAKNEHRKPLVTNTGTDFVGVLGTTGGPCHKIYKEKVRGDNKNDTERGARAAEEI